MYIMQQNNRNVNDILAMHHSSRTLYNCYTVLNNYAKTLIYANKSTNYHYAHNSSTGTRYDYKQSYRRTDTEIIFICRYYPNAWQNIAWAYLDMYLHFIACAEADCQ